MLSVDRQHLVRKAARCKKVLKSVAARLCLSRGPRSQRGLERTAGTPQIYKADILLSLSQQKPHLRFHLLLQLRTI